jgi:hypothetical protein
VQTEGGSIQEEQPSENLTTKEIVVPEIRVEEPQVYEVIAEYHEAPKEFLA